MDQYGHLLRALKLFQIRIFSSSGDNYFPYLKCHIHIQYFQLEVAPEQVSKAGQPLTNAS